MSEISSNDINEETLKAIQDRVLVAEKNQLHMKKPHNIIPEIKEIIEQEVQASSTEDQ